MEYLDFELPIKELIDQLDKCQIIGQESNVDVTTTCKQIEKKLEETKRKIYTWFWCGYTRASKEVLFSLSAGKKRKIRRTASEI